MTSLRVLVLFWLRACSRGVACSRCIPANTSGVPAALEVGRQRWGSKDAGLGIRTGRCTRGGKHGKAGGSVGCAECHARAGDCDVLPQQQVPRPGQLLRHTQEIHHAWQLEPSLEA